MDGEGSRMSDQAAWPAHVVEWATERTGGRSLSEEWERGPMLLGRSDFHGFYQAANARHSELLGWTIAELASVSWWEFVHPDDRDGMVEGIELLMKIGRWDDAEVGFLIRDGHYQRTRWSFLADPDDEFIYCVGQDDGVDFREWVRVRVGVWQWHPSAGTMTWSGLLFDPHPPTIYAGFLALVDDTDRSRLDEQVRASLLTGDPIEDTVRVGLALGPTPVRFAGTVHRGPDGNIYVCGIAQAIDERAASGGQGG